MQGAGLAQFAGSLWWKEHGKTVQAQRDVAEAQDLSKCWASWKVMMTVRHLLELEELTVKSKELCKDTVAIHEPGSNILSFSRDVESKRADLANLEQHRQFLTHCR